MFGLAKYIYVYHAAAAATAMYVGRWDDDDGGDVLVRRLGQACCK